MNIRTRITLTLSFTLFLVVAGLGIFIYVFTANFHKNEFFWRLEERVQITEKIFLEKNLVVEQAVRDRFLQRLDDEVEYAITLKATGLDSLDRLFYKGFSTDILTKKTVRFWQDGRQGVGRHYSLPTGEFAVVVTAIDKFGETKLRFLKQILLAGIPICLAVLIAVSWFTSSRVLRPLANKIKMASSIGANRLDMRLEVENPNDELGALAIAFNEMLDRLQASFDAQKQFVSNASHEIRNPLTAIIGETEVLLGKPRTPQEYREALEVIGKEAERMELLTRQLLDLAKAGSMTSLQEPEEVPIDHILMEVLEKFPTQRLQFNIAPAGHQRIIKGNRHLLHTAIYNVVDNAFKYSGEKTVSVELAEAPNRAIIIISDNGIGIPVGDLPHLYVPLHRARNARSIRGHGIGLPLAKKIIDLHGGTLDVMSEEGKGTVVKITLPLLFSR